MENFGVQMSQVQDGPSGKFGLRQHETRDWTIAAFTAPISRDSVAEDLKSNLNAPSLPEQLFGSSYLRLTHRCSGCVLEFNAADALRQWQENDEAPIQVAGAVQWQASREDAVSKVTTLQYDWTYSTSYVGSVRQLAPNDYVASHSEETDVASSPAEGQGNSRISPPSWQPSNDHIELDLLRARDPIQFYAEVPLYESELDDNGTSQLSVKVRVMPRCWYVLLRFFLRVDDTMVRLREARLFCNLRQPNKVVREIKRSEAHMQKVSANSGVAHVDAEGASVALAAIAPNGVQQFSIHTLSLSSSAE